MTIEQCRAARALLGWSTIELATAAKLGIATVKRFETGQQVQSLSVATMRASLDSAGIQFIDPGEVSRKAGAGVRLR
ncbi:XRE family transcriptional regulator [Sphingomonas paeninsulae]|uniref:XRE family transcriptional regulator n=1 Tax=Sphingomonas paeninsulae TaxID=2319844 RepID=A0A494TRC9_SPHPE|nr:XRE family transcriptional regulator [Sphingomonas paeninsulae]